MSGLEEEIRIQSCTICPRECGADRTNGNGFCKAGAKIKVARAMLHFWEEPCISGKNGSGTVFFSGCPLKCRYCQNYKISAENFGKEISVQKLCEIFFSLKEKGAHNINLVSPTQYAPFIIEALKEIKPPLKIPVVWNTGGYEKVETIKSLNGLVDIYLPDLKYMDSEISLKYSCASDYFDVASAALKEMYSQVGGAAFDENGLLKKGVIVRHLVLPGNRRDSLKILGWLEKNFPKKDILLSLMSQYTPYRHDEEFKELNRRISSFEYSVVAKRAAELGFEGYLQEKSSAKEEYTPAFDLSGI